MKKCSAESGEAMMIGKCDLSKCATMTKEECAKMCDSLGCSPEQKEKCLSHFDENGKFVAPKEGEKAGCCSGKKA
jgi:K(+)-stimulated pyrophosphate-energized sodium pump